MTPDAYLFDLDGVLTDTARFHYLAWKRLADERGFCFSEADNQRLKGVSRRRSLGILLELNGASGRFGEDEKQNMEERKNRWYLEQIRSMTPEDTLPGIRDFLQEIRAAGRKLAVASASRNAGEVLARLRLTDAFDYVADASRVARPKPFPDVFLDCCRALESEPALCIGIEDAQAGIEAIGAAGMFSVGIGVEVTGRPPDLPLSGVGDLNRESVEACWNMWRSLM